MIIVGIFAGHDAGAALFDDYRMVAAVALERMTRIKGDGDRFPDEAIDECLAVASLDRSDVDVLVLPYGSSLPAHCFRDFAWWDIGRKTRATERIPLRQMQFQRLSSIDGVFNARNFAVANSFRPDVTIAFYTHHFAHALGSLFHTDWEDAALYTADGGGDRLFYSARELRGRNLNALFGDFPESLRLRRPQHANASVALLYATVTSALGFVSLRHEGKVLGLAAYGKPRFAGWFQSCFAVDDQGRISGRRPRKVIRRKLEELAAREPREDVAASVQHAVEDVSLKAVRNVLRRTMSRRVGVAGGLFANVRLNQRLAEECELDELFVYPAMSDQGMAAGGVLQYLLERDGLRTWLDRRSRLKDVYLGRDYSARANEAFRAAGAVGLSDGNAARAAAYLIQRGAAVGTYIGRMEYGPRALGARSILARATERAINDSLNKRLSRTEFMPFAPVVRKERVHEIFDLAPALAYSANFMTTTCNVKKGWRDLIPAVVHVDGTARPQLIGRDQNSVYYDILVEYEKLSGLPVLINTSFNAHEEPIINTPDECAAALVADRVDAVVTPTEVWAMPKRAEIYRR
ncbi:MAG: Carbamoyltransferase [Nitrobacter sp.]|uniref:carbamoyltransferase C-terminal domain-containing protein n=1 Tax=Nitrobacter sp. TaxID=29420 RepID=UPI00387DE4A9